MKRFGILLAALVAALALAAPAGAAESSLSAAANAAFLANFAKQPGVAVRPSGLMYRIIHNGFGMRPTGEDYVTVYYTGTLINGREFDGTEEGMPARFKVNKLIAGWAEALQLMRVGDHWQVVIPANLAYGVRGTPDGGIPPNQTLVFDLQLLKAVPPKLRPKDPNADDDDQDDNDDDMGPDDSDSGGVGY